MTDPKFRYRSAAQASVVREWPDGRQESYLTTAPEYRAWLDQGNEPDPAPEIAPPPITVSRLRLKLELRDRGLLALVEAGVAQAGANAQLYWSETTEFVSDHALVVQIGGALGLSSGALLELFEAARDRAV